MKLHGPPIATVPPAREGDFYAALSGLLRSALSGDALICTQLGWTGPEDAPVLLAPFWWTGCRDRPMPVVLLVETPAFIELLWHTMPEWPEHLAARYERDCRRFHREVGKGNAGAKLRRFRLGHSLDEVHDFFSGSLAMIQNKGPLDHGNTAPTH